MATVHAVQVHERLDRDQRERTERSDDLILQGVLGYRTGHELLTSCGGAREPVLEHLVLHRCVVVRRQNTMLLVLTLWRLLLAMKSMISFRSAA